MTEQNVEKFRKRLKEYQKTKRRKFGIFDRRRGVQQSKKRAKLRFLWFPVLLIVTVVFLMKAFLVLRIGENQYRARLTGYANPSIVETIVLFAMRPDPLTLALRNLAKPLIGR